MIGEIIFYLERGLGKILQVAKGTIDDNRGGGRGGGVLPETKLVKISYVQSLISFTSQNMHQENFQNFSLLVMV